MIDVSVMKFRPRRTEVLDIIRELKFCRQVDIRNYQEKMGALRAWLTDSHVPRETMWVYSLVRRWRLFNQGFTVDDLCHDPKNGFERW